MSVFEEDDRDYNEDSEDESTTYHTFGDLGECDKRGCEAEAISYNANGEKFCEEHFTDET